MMAKNFLEKFDLQIPLIMAPMAGVSTPKLVAAASNAGALGSLAAAYSSPQEIKEMVALTRALTDAPWAINLFVPCKEPVISKAALERAEAATLAYRQELNIPTPPLNPPYAENFDLQFEACMQTRPRILSFTFGLLDKIYLQECRRENVLTIGTATDEEEALALEESGVDAIVAQGVEAGGHRGIFTPEKAEPGIKTFSLVKLLRSQIKIPVIAAGGIMNGKGIRQAIENGAVAAQLGTAFLACLEAGTNHAYRTALLAKGEKQTRLTRVFSGRLARGLENRFVREMEDRPAAILPFPAQNAFTRDLRVKSAQQNNPDFLSLWAGTGVGEIRGGISATELIAKLKKEMAD